jgi:hypothetical protein
MTQLLLPTPRHLTFNDGVCDLPTSGFVVLNGADNQSLRMAGQQLCDALGWQLIAGYLPTGQPTVQLNLLPNCVPHPQGYELTIDGSGVVISAETPAAIFYGAQTVRQLIAQHGHALPTLRVRDWPDFPNRGFMLDVSRDKVPTMATLYALVEMLASWKINQLQLYTEHTFAYQQHPTVWADASPLTGADILALDAFCRDRFIELVPNQNTFGHMRRWLTKPDYRHLAEAPDGCDTVWGWFDEPFTLNPSDPESLELVRSLFDELLPHFSSGQVNVGLDETVDLGGGHSKELVAEKGAGRVYLDFLLKIYQDVKRRGKTMQFWGDILMNHPKLVAELPRDVIALEWGYESFHDFAGHGAIFAASGIPFYVCPGTSSWRTVAGRSDNALDNLRNAAENGLKNGAVGYLITDWGDEGHWQPLPVSYLPLAYGAGLAWGLDANVGMDVAATVSRFAFRDSAEIIGQLAHDLGNVYQTTGMQQFNSTILFNALQATPEIISNHLKLEDETVRERLGKTQTEIEAILGRLEDVEIDLPDADLIRHEFAWAGHILRHACLRILWVEGGMDSAEAQRLAHAARQLIDDYDKIWHARNHHGGYRESVARLEKMLQTYNV